MKRWYMRELERERERMCACWDSSTWIDTEWWSASALTASIVVVEWSIKYVSIVAMGQ